MDRRDAMWIRDLFASLNPRGDASYTLKAFCSVNSISIPPSLCCGTPGHTRDCPNLSDFESEKTEPEKA